MDPAQEAAIEARYAGDAARNNSDWAEAIRLYGMALAARPDDPPIQIQLGHALGQAGRFVEAEAAYRTAIGLLPDEADAYLHLGHALKRQGRRAEAADAYVAAVLRDPQSNSARDEVIALGERGRLPESIYSRTAQVDTLASLAATLQEVRTLTREWVTVSTYPIEAYHAFRQAHPIQQPPRFQQGDGLDVLVLVDAVGHEPSAVRLTLDSLIDQHHTRWNAIVRIDADLLDHAVAGLAVRDPRIRFETIDAVPASSDTDRPLLLIDAGYKLDPAAIAWFVFAASQVDADAVYCDHDHHDFDWLRQEIYKDPVFQPMADPHDLASTPSVPSAVFLSAKHSILATGMAASCGAERRRLTLLALAGTRRVAHLPRLLLSRRLASPEESAGPDPAAPAELSPRSTALSGRLLVVIPTRDSPELLGPCVESLRTLAARPDLLDIVIIDNRSVLTETLDLLARLAASASATSIAIDEPFNWARFNNLAVAAHPDHDGIVFANNDMKMLSEGWDDHLRTALGFSDVGLVGTRLLYEDRTIQHAGVALGAGDRRPVHEGLGAPLGSAGPLRRWMRRRSCAAVTGAFMGIRRDVFERIGGFDESLPIGYNDIDLCLKVRSVGLRVLYEPSIELLHFESRTRGINDGREKQVWDDGELSQLYGRWSDWIFVDPGKNPHWTSAHSRVFDGIRNLSLTQVLTSLELSAQVNPWRVTASQKDR